MKNPSFPLTLDTLDPKQFPIELLRTIGFVHLLELDGDRHVARAEYEARPEFTHTNGTIVQGGFVTAWLDNGMAFAARAADPEVAVATLEVKVSFLQRATVGRQIVEARVVKLGRSVAFIEADLLNPAGELLARASSTAKLSRRPAG